MSKINPVFEALGGIDDDIAADAIKSSKKRKRKKPIKIVLIAAAAAAVLAMIVGFSSRTRSKFLYGYNDVYDHCIILDLYPHEFSVPEECKPQPGTNGFNGRVDMPLSELFEKFELPLLINDNFTEVKDENPCVHLSMPLNGILGDSVFFEYVIHDNIIDKNVYFISDYSTIFDKIDHQYMMSLSPGEPTEVVKLNNGSLCLVTGNSAIFSYYGAEFHFYLHYDEDTPDSYWEWTESEQTAWQLEVMPGIDTVKQVLADLGVL